MRTERLLILSDGKPGHLNQSIAFAKHTGYQYDILPVRFRSRLAKAVSYLADKCQLRLASLFYTESIPANSYRAVVSAGSETYYANRVLSHTLGCKSVAIMLPKGYRYDYDLIVAQQHDDPPERDNIISLPINLSYPKPLGIVVPEPGRKYVSLIIGGDTKHTVLDPQTLRQQVNRIFDLFPQHEIWMTTSRRTSEAVEKVLHEFDFSRAVYYSQEQINPIPDFLAYSDYVFLTADSTSMISEAVSFGRSFVELLPLTQGKTAKGKFELMISQLEKYGSIHCFLGEVGVANHKIDLASEFLKYSTIES